MRKKHKKREKRKIASNEVPLLHIVAQKYMLLHTGIVPLLCCLAFFTHPGVVVLQCCLVGVCCFFVLFGYFLFCVSIVISRISSIYPGLSIFYCLGFEAASFSCTGSFNRSEL